MTYERQIKQLIKEFVARAILLQKELHAKASAIAWAMNGDLLNKGQRTIIPSKAKPRKVVRMDTDDTLNLTRNPSKRQRFSKLLVDRTGLWARRDSDNAYQCIGPADVADHFLMQQVGSHKVITVSLITILSKWNHLP